MMFDFRKIFFAVLVIAFLVVIHAKILTGIGSFLVVEDIPEKAEAAVVLNGGVDIYPRIIEAADLYRNVKVDRVVINGNRKTDTLRDLESNGYEPPCKWYDEVIGVLAHQKVPKDHIVAISAEDAYDTVSEAKIVGTILINNGMKSVIISTSKFHSRRARYIWLAPVCSLVVMHLPTVCHSRYMFPLLPLLMPYGGVTLVFAFRQTIGRLVPIIKRQNKPGDRSDDP